LIVVQERDLALPKESEMSPKDKYTTFNRTTVGYRKSVHKVPKFTRVSLLSAKRLILPFVLSTELHLLAFS